MGCDIHGFIETRKRVALWFPFAKLYLPRNYEVFARLAGVRGPAELAVVAPRGLPEDASVITIGECTLYVEYSTDGAKGDRSVGTKEAAEWVNEGRSHYFGAIKPATITFTPNDGIPTTWIHNEGLEGFPSQVTNPDYHTFTWLTIDELNRAIGNVSGVEPEYLALSSAMKTLKEGGDEIRVVLWFDN